MWSRDATRSARRQRKQTRTIGHHTYDGQPLWTLDNEVKELTEHIKTTANAGSANALWKYFGIRIQAEDPDTSGSDSEKIDYLIRNIDQLREQRTPSTHEPFPSFGGSGTTFADAFLRRFGSLPIGNEGVEDLKYCFKCGVMNLEVATSCVACGQNFPA